MIRRATIIAVGKLKGWSKDGADDYAGRLRKHFPVEVVEVPESDMNRLPPAEVLFSEAGRILKKLPDGAHVVVLDRERGKQFPSEDLAARRLAPLGESGRSHVAFVLGGALGLAPEVLGRADEAWSFGVLTMPHALARVVLLEQLYRAVKIHRGEKYHW
ncbi:23S rRNA (pseudouridine(1915)-N(3))-methyltransferase RlmH [Rubrobacter indicoceani]|uniref:23S rRNA (pseudouridine(1915)-N(3))-methyltransferase RlmH n=1 Tax=Rubrobacter indicoceani TaxID=2051957 RepID=UPI0019695A39|nr:23S rRNA (pseudouridine(1915)-N(3))-methyltransferase RlmH [Rubrobacter indicoceani]